MNDATMQRHGSVDVEIVGNDAEYLAWLDEIHAADVAMQMDENT